MNTDIGLSSDQYFLAVVVFQIGYVIAEVPSKYGYSKYLKNIPPILRIS